MNISEIRIENFGKLKDIQFSLGKGINLVYAPNEGGKSTLHAFIRGMFFGMPRMRGRAAKTDSYSRYEPWENPAVYGGRMRLECGGKQFRLRRNFSKEFMKEELVCETDGERLSVEDGDLEMLLGNISETVYDNTISVGQLKGMTDQGLVFELRNYISGYQEGMDAGLNLKKAREKLKNQKKDLLKKIETGAVKNRERQHLLEEKIQEHQVIESQLQREWEEIQEKGSGSKNENVREFSHNRGRLSGIIFAVWLVLLAAGIMFSIPVLAIFLILAGGLAGFGWLMISRGPQKSSKDDQERTEKKIQIEKMRWQAQSLRERIQEEESLLENLKSEYEQIRRESAERNSLQMEVEALELADQTIERLSRQMQKTAGKQLQERLSEIFCELTQGKYQSIELDEKMEPGVHTRERYIPAENLSRGTLEQIYFAFRMAAGEILCREESLPVILDEAFVLYDDQRLAQTLEWLAGCGHQVILCTCHRREKEMMKKLGIPFREIVW